MRKCRMLSLPMLCAAVCLFALALASPAAAADKTARSLKITQFYIYPGGDGDMNKLEGLAWPEMETANALVRVELGGVPDDVKVSVFMVVFDPDDDNRVVSKHKSQHYLSNGEHDIVFPDFIRTGDYFGKQAFDAKIEVSVDGVKPVKESTSFVITGPEPPDVEIADLLLYNTDNGRGDQYFEPGDQFTLEATIDIEGNAGGATPKVVVIAVMEEDMFLTDPLRAQTYDDHWDSRQLPAADGVYRLSASGYLPLYFAEPWDFRHSFRVYVIVDFGPGLEIDDYASCDLLDYSAGDDRQNDELSERLIQLDRGYKWEWGKLRNSAPDNRRFWD